MSQVHPTNYWYGITAVTFALAGAGLLTDAPGLVLCAAVGVAYAGYAKLDADPPPIDSLAIERELDPTGEAATLHVTLTVTNVGERPIHALQLVDGVPGTVHVVSGTPRVGTALRRGESVEIGYAVEIVRGEHEWEPISVVLGNRSGSRERTGTIERSDVYERSVPGLETRSVPIRKLASPYVGLKRADTGGSGTEFFGMREYRHGDPIKRIDWRRFARTGELSTVQFNEERAATVVILIDAREPAYCSHRSSGTHAVDRCVTAAERIFASLLTQSDRVGVAIFGTDDVWFEPGTGNEHLAKGRHLLSTHPQLSREPPEHNPWTALLDERREELLERRIERLYHRIESDTQVLCLSPCVDGYVETVAEFLEARDHPVTVISPDPTRRDTPGHYLAATVREYRFNRLTRLGIPVIDWAPDESLEAAFVRAAEVRR